MTEPMKANDLFNIVENLEELNLRWKHYTKFYLTFVPDQVLALCGVFINQVGPRRGNGSIIKNLEKPFSDLLMYPITRYAGNLGCIDTNKPVYGGVRGTLYDHYIEAIKSNSIGNIPVYFGFDVHFMEEDKETFSDNAITSLKKKFADHAIFSGLNVVIGDDEVTLYKLPKDSKNAGDALIAAGVCKRK